MHILLRQSAGPAPQTARLSRSSTCGSLGLRDTALGLLPESGRRATCASGHTSQRIASCRATTGGGGPRRRSRSARNPRHFYASRRRRSHQQPGPRPSFAANLHRDSHITICSICGSSSANLERAGDKQCHSNTTSKRHTLQKSDGTRLEWHGEIDLSLVEMRATKRLVAGNDWGAVFWRNIDAALALTRAEAAYSPGPRTGGQQPKQSTPTNPALCAQRRLHLQGAHP